MRLQAFYYPPDAGLAMGGPGSSRFLRLEVHYHNPLLISGRYHHIQTVTRQNTNSRNLFLKASNQLKGTYHANQFFLAVKYSLLCS